MLDFGATLLHRTAFVADAGLEEQPRVALQALIAALVDVALKHRDAAGLYRWESRFLRDGDLDKAGDQMRQLHELVGGVLQRLRPTLPAAHNAVLSAAALSVLGSVADHHTALPVDDIHSVMDTLVADILRVALPTGLGHHQPCVAWPVVPPAAGIYEGVLSQSMRLFYQRGYQGATMDEIAAAAHTTVPVLYKHFASKSDILVASCRRATALIGADVSAILADTDTPRRGLQRLIASAVGRNLANPALSYVYYSERRNVPDADAQVLNALRQSVIDVLESGRRLPAGLHVEHGPVRVFGAFALMVDPGRMLLNNTTPDTSATAVRRLMTATLIGRR